MMHTLNSHRYAQTVLSEARKNEEKLAVSAYTLIVASLATAALLILGWVVG